jgi:hypothetical protein
MKTAPESSDDSEVRSAARNMIKRFGDDAAGQARIRAEEMRKYGDDEVKTLWRRVWKYIEALPLGKT